MIFDLAERDGRGVLLVVAFDGGIGVTAVNRDRLGEPVTADGLRETLLRRLCVPQDGSGYV